MQKIYRVILLSCLLGVLTNAQEKGTLTFDQIFPRATQQIMGLGKLTPMEKEVLQNHVESLLFIAMQVGYKQAVEEGAARNGDVTPNNVIESQINGDFEGWEGETVVVLIDGQVWQQIDFHYEYHYSYMPEVLIYNAGYGWKMRVEGIEEAVGVMRLK